MTDSERQIIDRLSAETPWSSEAIEQDMRDLQFAGLNPVQAADVIERCCVVGLGPIGLAIQAALDTT